MGKSDPKKANELAAKNSWKRLGPSSSDFFNRYKNWKATSTTQAPTTPDWKPSVHEPYKEWWEGLSDHDQGDIYMRAYENPTAGRYMFPIFDG